MAEPIKCRFYQQYLLYNGVGQCTDMYCSTRSRAKGGVALLWHASLNDQICLLNVDRDRIFGLQLQVAADDYSQIPH